ncbi:MarR family transcriptional regulator [Vallitalea pronyensis]|uniref:MarR family transcriptional regulator n=1 Tax=Vallitalea pronyensis TaxID=1348613 RepID=A0A8J8MNT2_9FIRM|nr:MarR family transcriptional regulator [Vallitalea pronyensis]QUI24608.1 MarR family transcriptional regulator [Vallitalea pronyensis]
MNAERDTLVKKIFTFMPLVHRKFFKGMHLKKNIHKMQLLRLIAEADGMPMKYYGEALYISKPNLTKMINRLIEAGFVERKHNEEDRRMITIFMTQKGRSYMEEEKQAMKAKMLEKLQVLSDEEVSALTYHFNEMEKILEKLS